MLSIDDLFKGRHFDREIIILCVRWYLRFKLSFSATSRNSNSGGTASYAEPAPLGASTKPT